VAPSGTSCRTTHEDPTALIFVIKVMFNPRILSLVFKIDCVSG